MLNGKYMRMALILKLLSDKDVVRDLGDAVIGPESGLRCCNPRCITAVEQELEPSFLLTDAEAGVYRCVYCEQRAVR